MPEADSFADLMTRLRDGDEPAAALIFHRFTHRLIGLARCHLHTLLRQKMDPEDVMQSVFRSFFARQTEQPYQLDDWNSLWSLLARLTVRKCGHHIEKFLTARRDIRLEVQPRPTAEESVAGWEAISRDPTPSEAAILAETVQELMRDLDERDRQILALSLQGCPIPEVSSQVGCTERTVYRVLKFIKGQLEKRRERTDDP